MPINGMVDRLILSFVLFLPALTAQSSLEIVEPADHAIIRPGDNLVVNVRTETKYDNLWIDGDRELKIKSELVNDPPYRFSLPIPVDIVAGRYRLWANGCGPARGCDQLDPVTIDVEPIWPDITSTVTDGPGVTVDTAGVPVARRSAMIYPKEAIERAIGGTIVIEVTPNSQGEVEGIQVLSGPAELRKDIIKQVLSWQFPTRAGRKPRRIEIQFDPVEAGRVLAQQRYQTGVAGPVPKSPEKATKTQFPPGLTPQRIRVPAAAQAAKLISKVDPVYPALAQGIHIQGVVRFSAILSKDGRVQNIQILKGHPLLVQAARDAASQWIYSPTFVNGMPVEVVTEIEVEFFLPN